MILSGRFSKLSLPLLLAVGCAPALPPLPRTTPQPSLAAPGPTPILESPLPQSAPEPVPLPAASALPTPLPVLVPPPDPSASPEPIPSQKADTTLRGRLIDENSSLPISGVKVKIESTQAQFPYAGSAVTNVNGEFAFPEAPDVAMQVWLHEVPYWLLSKTFEQVDGVNLLMLRATPAKAPTVESNVGHSIVVEGRVFDDTTAPLDGVTVKARSLSGGLPSVDTTITSGGAYYSFSRFLSGTTIEIIASKPGFTIRRRVEVLKSNKTDSSNKYDFGAGDGSNGTIANALSDKPEVINAIPGRNATDMDPKIRFVLKFSEPMNKATVVDNFAIRSFTTRTLTVDAGVVGGGATFTGTSNIATTANASLVWDKNAFDITWNSDDSEVTFTFKEEKQLPTDKDTDRLPDYQVSFSATTANGLLKDKSGISRDKNHFKLTEGDFEHTYKFAITADTKKPEVSSVIAQTNENQGIHGDAVKVLYSEPMIFYTKSRTVAGGMEDRAGVPGSEAKAPAEYPGHQGNATALNAAGNYTVKITPGPGSPTPAIETTWKALGGTAIYDPSDPANRTILLLPPTPATSLFAPGDTIQITVAATVLDPAGNIMDPARLTAGATAN